MIGCLVVQLYRNTPQKEGLMNTEIKPHLKVVQHPNPKRRSFHITREISSCRGMYGFGRESMMFSSLDREDPGEEAKQLAKQLADIPGITDGHFKQYEISVGIGDAFSWKDIGPLVLGAIVKAIYPEVVGETLDISTTIGWSYHVRPSLFGFMGEDDDGHRVHYQDMTDHQPVEVNFGIGRPTLDIEHILGGEALQEAKQKKAVETVYED